MSWMKVHVSSLIQLKLSGILLMSANSDGKVFYLQTRREATVLYDLIHDLTRCARHTLLYVKCDDNLLALFNCF